MATKILDMKKVFFTLTVFSVLFLASCQKFDNEKPLAFDVYLDSTTFKVGDPVTFKFTGGDANQISFYSGEVGNDYEYRDKNRIDQIKKVFFSFQTHNTPVDGAVRYKFLISTDYNGEKNYNDVINATWHDITNLYTFGGAATGAMAWPNGWVNSGNKEISSYIGEDKPFYIAVRVSADAVPSGSIPSRNWRTRQHSLIAETIGGNYFSIADYGKMGWTQIDKNTTNITGETASQITTSIMLFGYYNANSPFYRQEYDQWGVSKKFESGEISLGPSKSVSLKQYIDIPIESHTHYYEYPGTYKIVFLASNATISSSTQVIKELEITVNP